MRTSTLIRSSIICTLLLTLSSCIDNNNKDNGQQGQKDSNYENEAPTYNKTRDDIEQASDTVTTEKRVPKDPVEIKSKGNAASK